MGDPIELEGTLADALRAEARDRGFADGEAYLHWLVHNRDRLFENAALLERLEEVEHRLSTVEAALPADATDDDVDFWRDEELTEVIDEALDEPGGARDDDVAAAISDAENDLEAK